jgi:transcriptional regulator with XRE-family HTH domain
MNTTFAETLKRLRTKKGLSQVELGRRMFVNNSTVARWESGSRLPDAAMITRLSKVLDVQVGTLLSAAVGSDESPNVILVDDSRAILSDGVAVLEEVLPAATITGFAWPQEAIEYARANRVALAIVDIELGTASGLDLSRTLLEINPRTNVVFLTAYPDYALEAWETEASGFMVKPLTPEGVSEQLKKLRYPFRAKGAEGAEVMAGEAMALEATIAPEGTFAPGAILPEETAE